MPATDQQGNLSPEQRRLLTYRGPRAVSISGEGWDGLVLAGLIVDDISAIRLTPAGRDMATKLEALPNG